MKKLFKTLLGIVLFSSFIVNVNAESEDLVTYTTLKETGNYSSDVYMIGSTIFDGTTIINEDMVIKAIINDYSIQKYIALLNNEEYNKEDISIPVYYYNSDDKTWTVLPFNLTLSESYGEEYSVSLKTIDEKETNTNVLLNEEEVTEKIANKNIYYIDNEAKLLVYSNPTDDEVTLTDGAKESGVIYSAENDEFYVPANVVFFEYTTMRDEDENVVTVRTNAFDVETDENIKEYELSVSTYPIIEEVDMERQILPGKDYNIQVKINQNSYSGNAEDSIEVVTASDNKALTLGEDYSLELICEETNMKTYKINFNENIEPGSYIVTYSTEEENEFLISSSITIEVGEFDIELTPSDTTIYYGQELEIYIDGYSDSLVYTDSLTIDGVDVVKDENKNYVLNITESGSYTLKYTIKLDDEIVYEKEEVIEITVIDELTIEFNPNDGRLKEDETTKTVKLGEAYGELPVPTKDGYNFEGWYEEEVPEEGADAITSDTVVVYDASDILYAKWSKEESEEETESNNENVPESNNE